MDGEEKYLRQILCDLQEDYRRAAKPYIDRLVQIAVQRPPAAMRVYLDADGCPAFDIIDVTAQQQADMKDGART